MFTKKLRLDLKYSSTRPTTTTRPATIEDVAKLAGVSIATVSRTLSHPQKVAETTRKKVTTAIARTGYIANAMAQNLRKQRSKMVLVLAQSISDPNFPGILTGLEKEANSRGFGVLIGNTEGDISLEENYLRFLSTGMADGLILLTGHLPVAGWPSISKRHVPPMVAAASPISNESVSFVGVDDRSAAKVATEYLLSLGHRKIIFITGPKGSKVSDRRLDGYCDALCNLPDPAEIWKMEGDGTRLGGRAATERIFIQDRLPTAFFCYNDDTAIGVISTLQNRGYRVPEDISVIGFDDIPFANSITPALSTIRQPRGQIGELAMKMLLDSIGNPEATVSSIELNGDLIIRNSCAQCKSE